MCQVENVIHIYRGLQAKAPFNMRETLQNAEALGNSFNKDREEAVVTTLFNGIAKYAKQKNFSQAERLRDKLIEIAPMALSEITRSAEIIEEEKIFAMDAGKIELWKDLFKRFTKSEAAAFYFALNDITAKAGEPVIEQGTFDDRLFFINSGRVMLSYYNFEKGKSLDFAILKTGEIAGVESFFTFSNSNFTLTPMMDSKISILEKKIYEKLLVENPDIESKLKDYCEERRKGSRLESIRRHARRAHKRYPISLAGKVQKVSKDGKLMGTIMSMMVSDISAGGICYILENIKLNEASQLHKSWLLVHVTYQKGFVLEDVKKLAKVVSVQFHPFGECSIHVRFKDPLDEKKVLEISQYGGVVAHI
jgi:CRP-like cAMP-binding protein